MRCERRRHPSHRSYRSGIRVDAEQFVSRLKEIDEVAALAAPRIEDAHTRTDPATQQLIEQVDVDVAELRSKVHRRACYAFRVRRTLIATSHLTDFA
jgi:hypothetical protein